MARARRARVHDVHAIAASLPDVQRDPADPTSPSRAAYQVGGKTFVFFRGPRKDAHDPVTGELYDDVIAFHCTAEDKESLVGDPSSPWFTTPHWNGYNAVLLLERDLPRITVDELREVITDAWLVRAPTRLARSFLEATDDAGPPGASG
ncbi:MmcQ/YjbR family DNA-binding protein [Intrasporangium sp.]|uniref:MmcQ/YjbR family DNA-binding protein n=1 Tax=Intrasporangium sp. TaxID=1925024 RepID=UPI0029398D48|nr:MmcQ/YjbR family DNA-binding protein [Intrasporangium sp.]MDV3221943.1 MmcQ/YjbR family DNA-binding protein [Intrasporangium sp.]